MRAARVRHGRVLGLCGGHRHEAREPPFGNLQDGTDRRPGDGGRPGAPGTRCGQSEGDGRVRVPNRTQLQSHSAGHNGGREGLRYDQADMESIRARKQRATVHKV